MIIYEEIFRDFQKEKVKYMLVGGIAVNLHGLVRNTSDLDILVKMSDKNLHKIVSILKKHGYRVRQPVDPMGIADAKTRKDWIENKHMKAFNFFLDKEWKEVDIIIDSPVSYEEAKQKAKYIELGNLLLPLISVDHLIQMKENTGRDMDRSDIAMLKKMKELKNEK
ncbi:MAG: hypothetical protein HY587_00885 [Candidatus Omnitrophica bacterium]|nr:hypothetical protein [Candidatus Omnitrophota bacterium]